MALYESWFMEWSHRIRTVITTAKTYRQLDLFRPAFSPFAANDGQHDMNPLASTYEYLGALMVGLARRGHCKRNTAAACNGRRGRTHHEHPPPRAQGCPRMSYAARLSIYMASPAVAS